MEKVWEGGHGYLIGIYWYCKNLTDWSYQWRRVSHTNAFGFRCITCMRVVWRGRSVGVSVRRWVVWRNWMWMLRGLVGANFLVKIFIDITKPLARGRMLNLQSKKIWISFQYERLSKFCFNCKVIKHGARRCPTTTDKMFHGYDKTESVWLMATGELCTTNGGRSLGQPSRSMLMTALGVARM